MVGYALNIRKYLGSAVLVAFLVSGCSAVDRLNPFEREVVAPETENAIVARDRSRQAIAEAANDPYPELSDVPERPAIASRDGIQRALIADRSSATNSGQVLRQSGAAIPLGVQTSTSSQDAAIRAGAIGGTYRGPAPDPQGIDQLRRELAFGEQIRVAVIQFDFNTTSLADQDFAILAQVAEIAALTEADIFIVGHASGTTLRAVTGADAITAERASLDVSIARANAVADGLIGAGVLVEHITVRGVGTNEPAYRENSVEAEAGNRRAEIYLRN